MADRYPLDMLKIEIQRGLIEPATSLCEKNQTELVACFIPGSYATGKLNVLAPTINLYFIARLGRAPFVRLLLSNFFDDCRKEFRKRDINFALDCHPYTFVYQEPGLTELLRFEATTKVFEPIDARLSLPPTIGSLWLQKYILLYGSSSSIETLRISSKTDEEWFQAIHEALTRYKNILDHLPWAINWRSEPRLLVEESLRYAKEALRDGLTVVLTEQEINSGYQAKLYYAWDEMAVEVLKDRYGLDGKRINDIVNELKESLLSKPSFSVDEAQDAWLLSLMVWQIVWDKFCNRVHQQMPSSAGWMTRVNAFV